MEGGGVKGLMGEQTSSQIYKFSANKSPREQYNSKIL